MKACATKLNPGACLRTAVTVALVLGTGGEGDVALTAFERMATSDEAKILGNLAERVLIKSPLGPLYEDGMLTDTIGETNEFGAQAWHGWENISEEAQRMGEPRTAAGGDAPADRLTPACTASTPKPTRSPARCSSSAAGRPLWAG